MRGIRRNIKRIACIITAAATISSFMPLSTSAYAEDNAGNSLESIINEYEGRNPQVKDGLTLKLGDIRNISDFLNMDEGIDIKSIKSMDSNVVSSEGDFITANNDGDTYLVVETSNETFIYGVEVISPVQPVASYARSYSSDENNILKTQYIVFLDAGHGGKDPGATGNGLQEKDLTLDITQQVEFLLKNKGVKVIMRRTDDTYTDFRDIRGIINSTDADISVSVHINSAGGTAGTGIETYYADTLYLSKDINDESKELAGLIQNGLISKTSAVNRGVKKEDYSVISNTKIPAALTECGFINNPNDALLLGTSSYRLLLANGISEGIMKYLEENVSLKEIDAERIYGDTRFDTSYAVARMGWSKADTVIIANGMDYPDALCASPLSVLKNAPILLAKKDSLKNQTKLEELIKALDVKTAYIIGGTGVITQELENELKSKNIETIRLGGRTRYETSVLVANELGQVSKAVVASGMSFPDSLSASSIAAKQGMPILLSNTSYIPDSVKEYISGQNIETTYVIGGTGVVSDEAAQCLTNPIRLGGKDRYLTNEAVFLHFKEELNLNTMYIAVGTQFPDALSVSALAGREGGFVALSNTAYVTDSLRNIVGNNTSSISRIYVLGGPKLISDSMIEELGVNIR